MRIRSAALLRGLPAYVLAASCADGGAGVAGPAFTARDSAGIEIVDVARPSWSDGAGWTVSAGPDLEIGVLHGEEPYQLFQVTHAVRLDDGSIVVANRGTSELRWFGPDGRFVRSAGGAGEGPGEFDSLFALYLLADTLWAHDFRLARMTAFDTAGGVVGTVLLDRAAGLPMEVWPVRDGFVAHILESGYDIGEELTFQRRTARYLSHAVDGSVRDSIDALPGLEFLIRGGPAGGTTFVMTSRPPLIGHTSQQTVVGDRLVAGITDRFEIRVYGPDGGLERLIRDPSRDLPVTDAEWNAVLEEALGGAETPEQRRAVEAVAGLRPAPATRPAFGRFVADRAGFLWVAPWRPAAGRPVPWLVIDPDGGVLGAVDLPEGFRPTDIGADWVLGITRDELDVERVRLYRLTRDS